MRRVPALLLPLLLSGCLFGGGGGGGRDAPKGLQPARTPLPTNRESKQCFERLEDKDVDFRRLPDRSFKGGCSAIGTVQLLDFGVPTTNLGAMRCGLADAYVNWVRYAVVPAARDYLNGRVAKVETFGTYACRGTVGNGPAKKLSEHAVSNAVDISAIVLEDGRRITLLKDWNSSDEPTRRFFRAIRDSACRRFGTVLSPDYNAAHRNHFHLEDDKADFCR